MFKQPSSSLSDHSLLHNNYRVFIYSVAHFCVDFACIFFLFNSFTDGRTLAICILIYNYFAFAGQMPLGVLADYINKNAVFAAVGCLLICIAYGITAFSAAPSAVFAASTVIGIGNGMFHIGGGIDVLNHSGGKSGALGVFVSPGAFGVYFGTVLGKGEGFPEFVIPGVLGIVMILLLSTRYSMGKHSYIQNDVFRIKIPLSMLLPAICLFIVVCLRSYAGMMLNFEWKGEGSYALILVCATVLGKASGGFIADALGARLAVIISLCIAAALFFFPSAPPAGIIAVLAFNMTMPITLWAMAKIFSGTKGFAFGTLTFALFIGFLPAYLRTSDFALPGWAFSLIALCSLVLILAGLRKGKE